MKLPYQWQPKIVSTQVALIGNVIIAGVPSEFTTMSGRRLREAIQKVMSDMCEDEIVINSVIIAGLCNTYSDYVATPEEYQVSCCSLLAGNYGKRERGASRDFRVTTANVVILRRSPFRAKCKCRSRKEGQICVTRDTMTPNIAWQDHF